MSATPMRMVRVPGSSAENPIEAAPRITFANDRADLFANGATLLCAGVRAETRPGFRDGSVKLRLDLRVLALLEEHLISRTLAEKYKPTLRQAGRIFAYWNVKRGPNGSVVPPGHGRFFADLVAAMGRRPGYAEEPDLGVFVSRFTIWRTRVVTADSRRRPIPSFAYYSTGDSCLGSISKFEPAATHGRSALLAHLTSADPAAGASPAAGKAQEE